MQGDVYTAARAAVGRYDPGRRQGPVGSDAFGRRLLGSLDFPNYWRSDPNHSESAGPSRPEGYCLIPRRMAGDGVHRVVLPCIRFARDFCVRINTGHRALGRGDVVRAQAHPSTGSRDLDRLAIDV